MYVYTLEDAGFDNPRKVQGLMKIWHILRIITEQIKLQYFVL